MEEPSGWVSLSDAYYDLDPDDYGSQDDWDMYEDEDEDAHYECEVEFLPSWSRLTTVKRRVCVHVLMGMFLKEVLPFRARQSSSDEDDFALPYLGQLHKFYELCRNRWTLPMTVDQQAVFNSLHNRDQVNDVNRNVPRPYRFFWHLALRSVILPYLRAVGPACSYRKYEEENLVKYAFQALGYLTDPQHCSQAPASDYDVYFVRERPEAEILRDRTSQCALDWFEKCKKTLAWRTVLKGEYVK